MYKDLISFQLMKSMSREWQERDQYLTDKGFVLLTRELVSALAAMLRGKSVLDAGCGAGFLAQCLADCNVDVTAVDDYSQKYAHGSFFKHRRPVTVVDDALEYVGMYDVVILSWPDLNSDFSVRVANKMLSGQTLIYQGEGMYGCTGTDEFHLLLDEWHFDEETSDALNELHLTFKGINDRWHVYTKPGLNNQ